MNKAAPTTNTTKKTTMLNICWTVQRPNPHRISHNKNVVSSAAEAECVALFHNCAMAVGICHALYGLGHPQNCTEVITDNFTANSFVHSEMRVKRSKSWDMHYNLLRDRSAQQQFQIRWDKGIHNLADYFTKHHPPSHHCIKRYDYILKVF